MVIGRGVVGGLLLIAMGGTAAQAQTTGDTTAPAVTITAPPDGSFYTTVTPAVTAVFSDQGSGIDPLSLRFTIDGVDRIGEAQVGPSSLSWTPKTPLPDGRHTILVAVHDLAGWQGFDFRTFTTDRVPPSLSFSSPLGLVAENNARPVINLDHAGVTIRASAPWLSSGSRPKGH